MKEIKKIIYAEDEDDIRITAKMALELEAWEILPCNSGREVLEKVKDVKPDLILLDVMMPEMDGPTTFMELKKQPDTASIPVIFMTAKTQAKEIARYEELGAVGVITKPFDPMALTSQIKQLLGK
jgi:two-component system, OmpR family, response regulator